MNTTQWKVGDTLWCVPSGILVEGFQIIINKVGRKWLYTNFHMKIDRETLAIREGFMGQIYANKQAYKERIVLANTWQSFRDKVSGASYSLLAGLTPGKITEAERILGL